MEKNNLIIKSYDYFNRFMRALKIPKNNNIRFNRNDVGLCINNCWCEYGIKQNN